MASDDPRPDDNLEQNETSESEPDPSAESDQGLPDDVQQGVDHSVNPGDPAISEDRVREELKQVIDPELFVNIVDLGLVYEVTLEKTDEGPTNVSIDMTLTSPMCPAGPQLIA
ncbi:MAG: metal-sulfur cluster assembly factor, partial [Pirellulaceae bacterium]